jgi:predicted N-acetyltransferase YhbS
VTLGAPAPIGPDHNCISFSCGVASLDEWLKRRALPNQVSGASRTFVVADGDAVVGYFALAASSIAVADTVRPFARNMPDPIPVIVLGRLAVDCNWQGAGLGQALFRDAAKRVLAASEHVGARGMIVHALSDSARQFYKMLGMRPSPLSPLTMMVTCIELHRALQA